MYCAGEQVRQWIHRLIVDANLVVKMRPSRSSGRAHPPNKLTTLDPLALSNIDMRKVAVTSCQTTPMIDDDQLAVTILPTNKGNSAAGTGDYRITRGRVDVLSRMKFVRTATKRISPSAKSAFQLANHRPDRRCVTTFSQDSFVSSHFTFEPAHFAGKRC